MIKLNKMSIPVIFILFLLTISISQFLKPDINYVLAEHIDLNVRGVGVQKSNGIIKERLLNGHFKDWNDFKNRTENVRIGDLVYNRIIHKYKIGG